MWHQSLFVQKEKASLDEHDEYKWARERERKNEENKLDFPFPQYPHWNIPTFIMWLYETIYMKSWLQMFFHQIGK